MSPLHHELSRVGRRIRLWQATVRAAEGGAVAVAALFLLSTSDFLFRYGRSGRLVSWSILVAIVGAAAVYIWKAVSRKLSVEGVAATMERTFPQLDNRLINFVQFSVQAQKGAFESAYLSGQPPEWRGLNLQEMKNRRAHRRAWLAFGVCGLIAVAPGVWSPAAWQNAVLRIVNPFSQRPPSTLAVIRSVTPGNAVVIQGSPVVLACTVEGKRGQPVWIDLWPADDKPSRVKIGQLEGRGVEDFSFRIPQATTDTRYRLRAGDALSDVLKLRVRPPLAFTQIRLEVTPPAYTRLKPQEYSGLEGDVIIPERSTVRMTVACNFGLASAICSNETVAELMSTNSGQSWTGALPVSSPRQIRLTALDVDGYTADADLRFRFIPDRPPVIQVIAPAGQTVLGPGVEPTVQWQVMDDYAQAQVQIERVDGTGTAATNAVSLQEWTPDTQREFSVRWTGTVEKAADKVPLIYRIVAADRGAGGELRRVESPLIVFNTMATEETVDKEKKAVAEAEATLEKLVGLQSENLDRTRKLDATIDSTRQEQWKEAAAAQTEVRRIAGVLLTDARKPLGPLTQVMDSLFRREMLEAADVLRQVPSARAEERPLLAKRGSPSRPPFSARSSGRCRASRP